MLRRNILAASVAASLSPALLAAAPYPQRPLKMIVPSPQAEEPILWPDSWRQRWGAHWGSPWWSTIGQAQAEASAPMSSQSHLETDTPS